MCTIILRKLFGGAKCHMSMWTKAECLMSQVCYKGLVYTVLEQCMFRPL